MLDATINLRIRARSQLLKTHFDRRNCDGADDNTVIVVVIIPIVTAFPEVKLRSKKKKNH